MGIAEKAATEEFAVTKKTTSDKVIALAGNPNVGKSTALVVSVIWNGVWWSGL